MTNKKNEMHAGAFFCWFTGIWIALLGALNLLPFIPGIDSFVIPYSVYIYARVIGLLVILALAGYTLVHAYTYAGSSTRAWYQDGVLVAILVFWALFPPTWFFTEFSLFEHGRVYLPDHTVCRPEKYSLACEAELKRLKSYADLASKIWAGMAALFAATVGFSKFTNGAPNPREVAGVPDNTPHAEG